MKLTKLYCNDKNFKTVLFNDHLNIVEGKILYPENYNKDSHNLGKSTLAELIDFMLLKTIDKSHFLMKDKSFSDHVFFLEILTNNGKYLTIKRSIAHKARISIKIHDNRAQNFINEENWDYKNISIKSENDKKSGKTILNNLLNFDVMNNVNFRIYIGYFLRLQNDYNDIFRLSKFKGGDSKWKPDLFELLGYNKDIMLKKYKLENEVEDQIKVLKSFEEKFSIDIDEREKTKQLIDVYQKQLNISKEEMNSFDFINKESENLNLIVNNLETSISTLNASKYAITKSIKNIEASLKTSIIFDFDKVKQLFEECEIYFKDDLIQDYNSLIQFNNSLSKEREKYLKQTLRTKENELAMVEEKLSSLNKERKQKLSFLKESISFKKYQKMQEEVIELEKKVEALKKDLDKTNQLKSEKEQITQNEEKLSKIISELEIQLERGSKTLENIRDNFQKYIKEVTDKNSILYLKMNNNNNVEFNAEYTNLNKETNEAKGTSYKKIMCACFDLALLVEYSSKSFIKFVYHDGVFESLDVRKRKVYLELVNDICKTYNLQYILTTLESDLPIELKNDIKEKICLELNDEDDYSGTLFGRNF